MTLDQVEERLRAIVTKGTSTLMVAGQFVVVTAGSISDDEKKVFRAEPATLAELIDALDRHLDFLLHANTYLLGKGGYHSMRIKGHVTAVEDAGGELKITMQGSPIIDAVHSMQSITFRVPDFARNRQTFTVGRDLVIEIKPQ